MKLSTFFCIAGLLAAPVAANAAAAAPERTAGSHVDAYYTHGQLEFDDIDGDIDGDGYGLRFWLGNGVGVFTAQLGTVDLDGTVLGTPVEADLRELRAGLGWRFLRRANGELWARAEYVRFDGDIAVQGGGSARDDEDGYGLHVGGACKFGIFSAYAEGGVVDTDSSDGPEFTVGVALLPSVAGLFVEYRRTDLEADDFDAGTLYEQVRVGLRFAY